MVRLTVMVRMSERHGSVCRYDCIFSSYLLQSSIRVHLCGRIVVRDNLELAADCGKSPGVIASWVLTDWSWRWSGRDGMEGDGKLKGERLFGSWKHASRRRFPARCRNSDETSCTLCVFPLVGHCGYRRQQRHVGAGGHA